jgi:hypothetical protein
VWRRERLGTNSDISVLCQGLAVAAQRRCLSPDSSQPWDVFGAYRPPEPSDWLGGIASVQLPRDRAARWWFAPVVSPRGRNRRVAVSKGGTSVSTSVAALFYFLALVCFLGGAFAGLGRSSFATRVNLIALGLAFWVFVLFFNAFKRVIS